MQTVPVKLRKAAAALTHTLFVAVIALALLKGGKDPANSTAAPPSGPAAEAPAPDVVKAPMPRQDDAGGQAGADLPRPSSGEPQTAAPALSKIGIRPRHAALLDRLVNAYPAFLSGHDGENIIWKDGSRMPFDDGKSKSAGERLELPDLEDQFHDVYPAGRAGLDPDKDFDPGRVRYEPFFKKMYGDCHKGEVTGRLTDVVWLPNNGTIRIKATKVNGVAEKLQLVSNELDRLPERFIKYLRPVAGVYNCRVIAGTARLSVHAYGAAIDINPDYGDYWQWSKRRKRQVIPWEIIEIFEKHGFIWGGKWYHFDTFHFEYRPELFTTKLSRLPSDPPAYSTAGGAPPSLAPGQSEEPAPPPPTRQQRLIP